MNYLLKDKKGEGETGSRGGAVIAALVALFVLIIVLLFLFGSSSDLANRLRNLIPGFNTNQTAVVKTEIIGFGLESGNLKFYDGTAWQEFQSDVIKLGSKRISKSQLAQIISDRFYNRALPEKISLTVNSRAGERVYYPKELVIYSFGAGEKGKTRMKSSYVEDGRKEIYFILNPDDSLWERREDGNRDWQMGDIQEDLKKVSVLNVYQQFVAGTYAEEFSTDIIKHLKEISGMKIPFGGDDLINEGYRPGTQLSPQLDVTQAFSSIKEIALEKDYKLVQIEVHRWSETTFGAGEDYVKYKVHYQNAPVDIYLKLFRAGTDNSGKPILGGEIIAKELSKDIYVRSEVNSAEREIIEKTVAWKESVLKTPIVLLYEENDRRVNDKSFCIKKIGNLLTVNLAEPKTQCN